MQLTDNRMADSQPDVGPDGRVAFWRESDVWTMGADGSDKASLAAVRLGLGFNPRWSPDGTKLAMPVYEGRAHLDPDLDRPTDLPLLDVVVVDLETGQIRSVGVQVASDVKPPSRTPEWRPVDQQVGAYRVTHIP